MDVFSEWIVFESGFPTWWCVWVVFLKSDGGVVAIGDGGVWCCWLSIDHETVTMFTKDMLKNNATQVVEVMLWSSGAVWWIQGGSC